MMMKSAPEKLDFESLDFDESLTQTPSMRKPLVDPKVYTLRI